MSERDFRARAAAAWRRASRDWRESFRSGGVLSFVFGYIALGDIIWPALWTSFMAISFGIFAAAFVLDALDFARDRIGGGGWRDIFARAESRAPAPADAAFGVALYMGALAMIIGEFSGEALGAWARALWPAGGVIAALNAARLGMSPPMIARCGLTPLGAGGALGLAAILGG